MKKSKNKPKQMVTRRQALSMLSLGGMTALSGDPIRMFFRAMVDGMISNAQAAPGGPSKNYVAIILPGAPPSNWIWGGYLNPNNETIVTDPTVANYLTDATYTGNVLNTVYRSEAVSLPGNKTIYLPPLWNRNIPTSLGGLVPMNSLLNNAIMIRGVDMQVDLGHAIGPAKVTFPLGAIASLSGLVGDTSSRVMPVVGTAGSFGAINYADPRSQGYQSLLGTAPILVNNVSSTSNSIANVLKPFQNSDSNVKNHLAQLNSASVQTAMQNALSQLGSYASSSLPGSDSLYKNASNAQQLFQNSYGNLTTVYTTLYNKYYNLIKAAVTTPIPYMIPATGGTINSFDTATGVYTPGTTSYNLGATFSSTLAGQFAVAEFLLVNGLSACIAMDGSGGFNIANLASGGADRTMNDEHTVYDRQASVIVQSAQFLAISALINELKSALGAAWNQTVVHVSAEFGRSPYVLDATSGTAYPVGTNHSVPSNSVAIFSGAITQPIFIGNIYTAGAGPTAPPPHCTYGAAAPVSTNIGTQIINNGLCAATVAAILGVQSPVTAASSLVAVDANGIVTASNCENPKNV